MILTAFKTEFSRIATVVNATYKSKNYTELEDYVNEHDFEVNPVINLTPLKTFKSNIGVSGQVYYSGIFQIEFLTKSVKSNNLDDTKDALIDQMIELQKSFYINLHKNEQLVFQNSQWDWNNEVLRQYTSNFLVGVKSSVSFSTQCARL